MANNSFYSINTLIQKRDLDGQAPEIYMIVGNRTAGKTFAVKSLLIERFKKKGEKFIILKRLQDSLKAAAGSYWKDIEQIKYPGEVMDAKCVTNAIYEISINGDSCGYIVALNGADGIRENSALFADVAAIHFDEFQSESGRYCPGELEKFQSVHTSIARGGGKHVRRVPVYMTSNAITLLNPYYSAFGIAPRLKPDTRFLRGRGWVLEVTKNANAAAAIEGSGFGRAFQGSDYMQYALENQYLDNSNFIEQVHEKTRPLLNISHNGALFSVKATESGLYYVTDKVDTSCRVAIATTTAAHGTSTRLALSFRGMIPILREGFSSGLFRFSSLKAKEATLALLALS